MELRHLRYFAAVAEELHFGRAAERLGITTPTLSQQVKALENEVGAPLLIRGPRGAELTAAGTALLPEARAAIGAADSALAAARRAGGAGGAALRLGVLPGVPDWLPGRLERSLAAIAPERPAELVAGSTSEQLALLRRRELELATVRVPVDVEPEIELLAVHREVLGVLLSPEHPLAARALLGVEDLDGVELILFPRDRAPGAYDDLLAQLEKSGARPRVSATTMSMAQHHLTLPLRPQAIGLASSRAAKPPDVVWRPLEGDPLALTVSLAWMAAPRNADLRALVAALS